jgi:hypothetical protein
MTVKVTVASDGHTITIETDDLAAAVAIVKGVCSNGTGPMEDTTTALAGPHPWDQSHYPNCEYCGPVRPAAKRKPARQKAAKRADKPLSRQLSTVHERLVALGEPTTPSVIADHLALAPATAGYRLKRLVEKGYATQTGHGRYRAVE